MRASSATADVLQVEWRERVQNCAKRAKRVDIWVRHARASSVISEMLEVAVET